MTAPLPLREYTCPIDTPGGAGVAYILSFLLHDRPKVVFRVVRDDVDGDGRWDPHGFTFGWHKF